MDALITAVVAVVATALASPIVIRLLNRFSVVDRSDDRSSHDGVVLRGGGLALIVGATVAIATGLALVGGAGDRLVVSLTAVACLAALGFADDLHTLPAAGRLAAQLILAAAFAALLVAAGLHPLLAITGLFWLVVFVNAFNFMDGINGISGATGSLVGLGLAVTALRWGGPDVAVAAAAVGGASLGFLPVNYPNARVFLGDVGSYAIGAALAALSIVLLDSGAPIVPIVLPFSLYVADVFFTLLRRWRRGENILRSHREHVYQRLANGGLGHTKTTALVALLTAALVGLGQTAGDQPAVIQAAAVVVAGMLIIAYLASPRRLAAQSTDSRTDLIVLASENPTGVSPSS